MVTNERSIEICKRLEEIAAELREYTKEIGGNIHILTGTTIILKDTKDCHMSSIRSIRSRSSLVTSRKGWRLISR